MRHLVLCVLLLSAAVSAFVPTLPKESRRWVSCPTMVLHSTPVAQENEPRTSTNNLLLTLTKPLGLLLEEVDGGGVRVEEVTATGSAAPYATELTGTRLVRVNDARVVEAPLDRVMELIAAAAETVALEFQRPKVPLPVGTPVTISVVTDTTMDIQARVGDNLRQTLLNNNVDVYAGMQKITNCGGAGQCTLCAFDILDDHGEWEERSDYENSRLKSFPLARLTCLNVIQGPATIQKTKR